MRFSWHVSLVFFLVCQLFLAIYVIYVDETEILFFDTNATLLNKNYSTTNSTRRIPDACSLPNYSSWDPRIMKYSDVFTERKKHLCEKPEEWAYLEEQVLKSRSGYLCRGRCVNYDDYITFGVWQDEETKFDCDFIETECSETRTRSDGLPADMRGSVLSQFLENRTSLPLPSDSNRYNIYVIVVDSTGFHQSRRNLPKSLYFMNRELEAVEYSYVNKVGLNSYPNAIPLWYGRAVEDIEKQMLMGQNKTPADWETTCNDSQKAVHILREAKNAGYQTLSQEYWYSLVLKVASPCRKYTKDFRADHGLPLLLHGKIKALLQHRHQGVTTQIPECELFRKTLSEELSYFSQFMNSYKNVSKFGWLWLVQGSHDYETESMLEDTELYDFFIRNKAELGNSFVFFMADHGLRFGETHYDTRATMLDIINYQPAADYTAWKMEQFGEEKGNSYLREQHGPRTCHTLPIPFQYCICQYKMQQINSTSQLGKFLANSVLAIINQKIIDSNHRLKCGLWQLKEAEIEGFDPISETGTFQILIRVRQDGRENAAFRTTARYNDEGKLELILAARVDIIWTSADCATQAIKEYCYCRSALFRLFGINLFEF